MNKPILIIGHDHDIVSALIHIRSERVAHYVAVEQEPGYQIEIKPNIMQSFEKEQAERLSNSLFNKMLSQSNMFAPRQFNQRQKRKRWRQSPSSRPCKNHK